VDPYKLFNGLDEQYVPLARRGEGPRRPPFPSRVRSFVYACAFTHEQEQANASGVR
jgi:hypothetical protein